MNTSARFTICALAVAAAGGITIAAQQQNGSSRSSAVRMDEAAAMAEGWTLLTRGQTAPAASRASQMLQTHPRSASALALAIEAQIGAAGAAAALGQYEQWLGQRTLEEPLVLRRLSVAALREEASQTQDPAARAVALEALAAEQEIDVESELAGAVKQGARAEIRLLAAAGNDAAVKTLIAELNAGMGSPGATFEALARSGNAAALETVAQNLKAPRPEVRAAAVDALARAGGAGQVDRLKPLLADSSPFVRGRAAAGLFRLGDDSGVALLRELAADESPISRIVAAEAMASRPDAAWHTLVGELAEAKEPEIQVGAARLMAPHDPQRARAILEKLAGHPNIAIREIATRAAADIETADLATLRKLMRNPDRLTRIRAAGRILAVTR